MTKENIYYIRFSDIKILKPALLHTCMRLDMLIYYDIARNIPYRIDGKYEHFKSFSLYGDV
jgi:hypothetical protein